MARTVEYAYEAGEWARATCPGDRDCRTRWELLVQRTRSQARMPGRVLVKRDQVSVPGGVNHNLWPALSRMLIMADPALARTIFPRAVADLDGPEGAEVLARAYERATGGPPPWRDWREAAELARGASPASGAGTG
ncbi:Uncharacterised protein [Slackia heliotrinireducens]|uniref:Uncharacterized protein n=1 Tax=Slackia heliotrinireducens (strain ATCC 29202 / DSM 20476 / NCTC 11029 / RHS 1) TaxID=471855 RepID=C7N6S4_SLAHD|nr:hypothetical protein [Slackia heliotrinireducens]ACV22609.1 hypothetical protein Shel_15900 [Slackia heliotrinireducens DSM 20476]VEH01127.1 Uncharacterised protein [Slackia heliotrinireducens]